MPEAVPGADLERILRRSRTIAVLGAHPKPSRPAFYVADYLHRQGYRVLPVNPRFEKRVLWDGEARPALADLREPVDVVVVFRRSEHVPGHLDDILAMDPKPEAVWLQQGIRNDDAATRLESEGIDVVQDACMLVEHRRFGLSPLSHA